MDILFEVLQPAVLEKRSGRQDVRTSTPFPRFLHTGQSVTAAPVSQQFVVSSQQEDMEFSLNWRLVLLLKSQSN